MGRVKGPAIGLIVTAAIGMLWQVLSLGLNALGTGIGASQGGNQGMSSMMSGGVGIVFNIVAILMGIIVLLGALKMMKLQSYGFAMAASIIAMVPCVSPCCILGLPFGIWALVVLMDAQVKAAFTN